MYQILIADDHPLFQSALKEVITQSVSQAKVDQVASFDELHEYLKISDETDLVLMDLKMPGNLGLMGLLDLRKQFPQTAIAICSANENEQMINNALHYGAVGYIPKSLSMNEIKQAIRQILQGEHYIPAGLNRDAPADQDAIRKLSLLTPQQLRVLKLIAKGLLNKQIAWELNIKETTIKTHVSDILKKLEIGNRTQAAVFVQFLEADPDAVDS